MFKIINSVDELPNYGDKPIFFDLETDGLYTNVRLAQFYNSSIDEDAYIVDLAPIGYDSMKYIVELEKLKKYALSHHIIAYNASYDLGTLNISPKKVDDLYFAIKIAYPEFGPQGFGLKKIVKRLRYTANMYDDTEEDHGKKGFPRGAYISQSALRYATKDVVALDLIYKDPKIRHAIASKVYQLDILSLGYSLIYQQNGLLLNRDKWEDELQNSEAGIKVYEQLLPVGFNPNSYLQVRKHLGITKSNHEALIAYSLGGKHNAIDADSIINLKRCKKEVSYLKSINFNKMITKFNPAGAVSGRFTASGGNLDNGFNSQQIPRKFQYLFNSPTEGTSILDADYSTVELRIAAGLFGAEHMYNQFKEGKDLHTEMVLATNSKKKLHKDGVIKTFGTEIDNSEWVTSEDRIKAKAINFGFVFGMSASSFIPYAYTSYGIKYTKIESEKVRGMYFRLYPEIARIHRVAWNNYKDPKFLVYTAMNRPIKPKLGTDGINTPVQGTGAETLKLAIHYLVEDYGREALNYIYNVVHDCIQMRVPVGTEQIWANAMEKSMLKGWKEISKADRFKWKDIPIEANPEIHILKGGENVNILYKREE